MQEKIYHDFKSKIEYRIFDKVMEAKKYSKDQIDELFENIEEIGRRKLSIDKDLIELVANCNNFDIFKISMIKFKESLSSNKDDMH